jgi:hypothetical protein
MLIFGIILALMGIMGILMIFMGDERRRKRHHHERKFKLQVIFHQQINHLSMASINSITLTDTNPHSGLIVMIDNFGNTYTGTLQNGALSGFDTTQDTLALDSANPNTLDVTDVAPGGGTTGTLKGDWVSQGNGTSRPNPDPTKPPSQAILDGTVMSGLSCPVTVINKIPTTVTFALQVNF